MASDRLPAAIMPCAAESLLPTLVLIFLVCHCKLFILAFIFFISSVLAFHYCTLFISKAMLEVEILTWRMQIKVSILPIVQKLPVSGSHLANYWVTPGEFTSTEKRQLFYNPTTVLGKEIFTLYLFPSFGCFSINKLQLLKQSLICIRFSYR